MPYHLLAAALLDSYSGRRVYFLAVVITCLFFSGVDVHATDAIALEQQVEALPANQPWEKLKKATLEGALEDAKAARDQGFPDRSNGTLKDVETLLPKDIGHAQKPPGNPFPFIPKFETNPHAKMAFGQQLGLGGAGTVEKLITSK